MTTLFLDRGYRGACFDLGEQNRLVLRKNLAHYGDQVTVVDSLDSINGAKFDYLLAFEVLEHIQQDEDALRRWTNFLQKDGRILISVPAHMRKFGKDDEYVGHVRRYEKQELIELLKGAGYSNILVLSYGYPLGNLTRLAERILHHEPSHPPHLTSEQKSMMSGIQRSPLLNKLSFLFNETTLQPFNLLQRLFYNTDLGDGYIAYAKLKK